MRVVLGCNVLVSAARTDGVRRAALLMAVGRHEVVLSEPIIDEYRTVGARPRHRPYRATASALTEMLVRVAVIVEPADTSFGLDDPDDEVYLATALSGGAEILVTGDRRHFPASSYGPIEVLTPAAFLARYG